MTLTVHEALTRLWQLSDDDPAAASLLDELLGAWLTAAGEWMSPRRSDGVTWTQLVARDDQRARWRGRCQEAGLLTA